LIKAALLLAPFALLSAEMVARTLVTMVRAERAVTLRDGVFSAELEGKIRALVTADTRLIIAGDSRAERQVIPEIAAASLGGPAVNIATAAGELVMVKNALRRYGLPPATRLLVISASIFQVNDGSIDPGYISEAGLLNMTPWERAAVYADRLRSPSISLQFRFREAPPLALTSAQLPDQGFVGITGTLGVPLPEGLIDRHPWYRNIDIRGGRWRIFAAALDELAQYPVQIHLFQPPVSPAWLAYTAETFVGNAEREFIQMLRDLVAKYDNVHLHDFYSVPDARLGNDAFYDIQHLNRAGAEVFTRLLTERIAAVPPHPVAPAATGQGGQP